MVPQPSPALLSNNYRFQGYQYTITTPNGTSTTTTFTTAADPTSDQYIAFTPTQTGTYTFTFNYPGQVYGAKDALYPNGDGYQLSALEGDTYEPSNATTTLTVQQTSIPAAVGSSPLPTAFWTRPIYGENSQWYTISSNWLGSGSAGYSNSITGGMQLFHPDGAGSLASHIMWTKPLTSGGVVGGSFGTTSQQTTTFDPNTNGVGYFEGSAYEERFGNPIIVDGYLYYNEPIGFTGPNVGPLVCLNLETGQTVWTIPSTPTTTTESAANGMSNTNPSGPQISFAYVYNLWDGDEHGTFPPILFTAGFGTAYDAYTGVELFNVTGVPSGTAAAGPSGEQLKYIMTNTGTTANPQWYLSEWNSSKLWQYDINPYNSAGSNPPSIINATNGALAIAEVAGTFPLPINGETAYVPGGANSTASGSTVAGGTTISVPYGSSWTVNANVPINGISGFQNSQQYPSLTTYDWNISIPWHNTMTLTPAIVAVSYNDIMLCRNGSLPVGFANTQTPSLTSQNPYTYFAVDVNTSHSTFGQVLWSQTYTPPPGNLTFNQGGVDLQYRCLHSFYLGTFQLVRIQSDKRQLAMDNSKSRNLRFLWKPSIASFSR